MQDLGFTPQNSAAPPEAQLYLLIALVVGILIIFPVMGFLYKTFKFNEEPESRSSYVEKGE